MNHSSLFAKKYNHINGKKNFWKQPKRPMRKFSGILKVPFIISLKECEGGFNRGASKDRLKNLTNLLVLQPINRKVLFIKTTIIILSKRSGEHTGNLRRRKSELKPRVELYI